MIPTAIRTSTKKHPEHPHEQPSFSIFVDFREFRFQCVE